MTFITAIRLVVAGSAAIAVGALSLAIAEAWWARPAGAVPHSRFSERLLPWLRAAALPEVLRRRWVGEEVQLRLARAGLPWMADDFAALRWISLWIGMLVAALVMISRRSDLLGWFLSAVAIGAAWFGPTGWMEGRLERRQQEIERALPDLLDRLSLALEAGLAFDAALRRSARTFPGRLGEEVRRLVRSLDRGHRRGQALEELAGRNPSEDLRAFTAALRQADRLGTSLTGALRVQGALSRARRRRRAQEAGRRLPVLIVFPLVFFFLPSLLIVYLAPPLLHLFLGR